MKIIKKEEIKEPINNAKGELFYEMIGIGENLGNAEKHSFGKVIVLNGYNTNKHYHPEAEETYYILKGHGTMMIQDKKIEVEEGDTILISPNETHQLFAKDGDIEAIVICSPAWHIDNTVFIEGE